MKKIVLKIIPYFSAVFTGVVIYIFAIKVNGKLSDLLVNISATFFAIPLLVLFYDLLKRNSDKKMNIEIDDYVKLLVDRQVLSATNQISKLIYPLEQREFTFKNISKIIQFNEVEIGNEITNKKYLGFQVFKNWEITNMEINELLRNSLIANKIENEKIIVIIRILKGIKALETVLGNQFLYIETDEKIEGYKIDKGYPNSDNFLPDRYMLLKHLNDDKYQVCDFGDIKKYNLDKCLKSYVVNDKYKKGLVNSIFSLLDTLNEWVKITGNEIIIDQDMFRVRRK
jgi:hypothetical protein